MNIGQVRYFVSVYESGSFSRAAQRLSVSVQATSKAVADLEREIGADLFERKSRGVEPTPLAVAFYSRAVGVLRSFDELEAFARDPQAASAASPGVLELALCSPKFPGHENVFNNIANIVRQNVNIETRVRLATVGEGISLLKTGDVDALITIGSYDNPETDCVPLLQAPSGVCAAVGHPLFDQGEIALEDVAKYPIITIEKADLTEKIYELYRERGFTAPYERITDLESFNDAYLKRQAIMFCVGLPALSDDQSIVRPVRRGEAIPVPICFVSLKGRKTPAYLAAEYFLTKSNRRPRS